MQTAAVCAVCIKANKVTAGDFGLNKPRSPFLIARQFRVARHPPAIGELQTELTLHQEDLGSPGIFEGFT
jgi:hypothetical protein